MQLEEYFDFVAADDIRLRGHRLGIESVLYEYLFRSQTPEEISRRFETLRLDQVYATILYYLRNEASVRQYMTNWLESARQAREEQPLRSPEFVEKIRKLRAEARQSQASVQAQVSAISPRRAHSEVDAACSLAAAIRSRSVLRRRPPSSTPRGVGSRSSRVVRALRLRARHEQQKVDAASSQGSSHAREACAWYHRDRPNGRLERADPRSRSDRRRFAARRITRRDSLSPDRLSAQVRRYVVCGFHSSIGRLTSGRNGSVTFCPAPAD